MTVWFDKGRDGYRYNFYLFKERHTSPRTFPTEREALDAEAELRRKLRRQAAGLEPAERPPGPSFTDTAGAYYQFAATRKLVGDLETLDRMHRCILRFFGEKPDAFAPAKNASSSTRRAAREQSAPYRNLTLRDVVEQPRWLLEFEDWMTRQGLSGSTKNRYRSACSRLYWFAMLPANREATGITANPFRGILRDREMGRDVTLSADEIRRVIACAPPHLRLAVVIGALAPKLRLGNILALRWDRHFNAALTLITVKRHKTAHRTGRPLKAAVSEQLRRILEDAKQRQPKGVPWVVHYRRGPIRRVETGLAAACKAAGVVYGRANDGPTFHTIRHSAATLFAELGVAEGLRKQAMGHLSIQTTQKYTHLQPVHERAPLELLSTNLPLEDLMTAPRRPGVTRGVTVSEKPLRRRPARTGALGRRQTTISEGKRR